MSLADRLQRGWSRPNLGTWLTLPLAGAFRLVAALRRLLYRRGVLPVERLPVAVVVVGNITAGGSGKTPVVIALVEALRGLGFTPGVISRGYGGSVRTPRPVEAGSPPAEVGDEPVLIAARTGCPVWVGRDRAAVGRALVAAAPTVDVLVADDGLQHYRLARDVEVVVMDARGAGNGLPLPSGPLREPLSRLGEVAALVLPTGVDRPAGVGLLPPGPPVFRMRLEPGVFYRLDHPATQATAADLRGLRLHAVAGIGDPSRFFATLASLGLHCSHHPFPDHHAYAPEDLAFADCDAVLMTEKDAVKCRNSVSCATWVLPVSARFTPDLGRFIANRLHGSQAA